MKRTHLKLVIIAVLVIALTFPAAGCVQKDETIKVGFTAMNLTSEFHIAARDTLKALCEENGYEFVSVDGNNDNQRQINAIEDMITAGIDYLVLCPVSRDGILPALQACEEAGVTVIGYDSKATDTQFLASYIASDNEQAGRLTGEYLLEKS